MIDRIQRWIVRWLDRTPDWVFGVVAALVWAGVFAAAYYVD